MNDKKLEAGLWAWEILRCRNFFIVDSETTGLFNDDHVVELAIVDWLGNTVFSSRFDTDKTINWRASQVSGITNRDLFELPTFEDYYPVLSLLLESRLVLCYNYSFDQRLINQTCDRYNLPRLEMDGQCLMQKWTQFNGKRQKLGGDHSAAGDCRKALKLLREMALWGRTHSDCQDIVTYRNQAEYDANFLKLS